MSEHKFKEQDYTSKVSGKTVVRILGLTKPHLPWLIGFLVTIALVSGLDSVFTYIGKLVIDDAISLGDTTKLKQLLGYYAALTIVQSASVFGFIYMAGILGERINYDLRKKMFNHLQELSFSYYDKTPIGWIISRVTSDATKMADLVTWGLLDVTWGLMNIISAMVFMTVISPKLALVVFAVFPMMLLVAVQFQKRIIEFFRKVRKQNSKLTGAYNENISGVRVVKSLSREPQNLKEFDVQSSEMYRAAYRAAWWSALFLP
ncbi:MAG: ABC transporter transmembrane domain-containing protein, partial [Chloroflexota bacterium]